MGNVCCAVVSVDCKAPANLMYSERTRLSTSCYHCGEDVCTNCSQLIRFRGLRVRMCIPCIEMEELNV